MIQCEILVTGPYSDYEGSGHNRKARVYSEGDVALFPMEYAKKLETSGMVIILTSDVENEEVIEIEPEDQDAGTIPAASESAQEYAAHHQVDLKKIEGTGKHGRVILADVHKYVNVTSVE